MRNSKNFSLFSVFLKGVLKLRGKRYVIAGIVTVLTALWMAAPVMAVGSDKEWKKKSGGSWHNGDNWDSSLPIIDPGVPDGDDNAIFDLNATYTVTLSGDADPGRLYAKRGEVTLDLRGHDLLLGPGPQFVSGFLFVDNATISLLSTTGPSTVDPTFVQIAEDPSDIGWLEIGRDVTVEAWTSISSTDVGLKGIGYLHVPNGGSYHSRILCLGTYTSATGYLIVDAGATVRAAGLTAGNSGTAFMTIEGELVDVGGSGEFTKIGWGPESIGNRVSVLGSGSFRSHKRFVIGLEGNGTVEVQDSGVLKVPGITVGMEATGSGLLSVHSDVGVESSQDILVGENGAGSLVLWNEGQLTCPHIIIARNHGSSGEVQVGGVGDGAYCEVSRAVYVGGSAAGAGGSGELSVESGGMLDPGDVLRVWSSGIVNLSGGEIIASSVHIVEAGGFTFTGGRLSVITFKGDLVNSGGVLVPAPLSRSVVIAGDYTQEPGGTLEIEINGRSAGFSHDELNVDGRLILGGTLDIILGPDLTPQFGDRFDILDFPADQLTGAFDTLNLPRLPFTLFWDTSSLYTTGEISVGGSLFLQSPHGGILVAGTTVQIFWRVDDLIDNVKVEYTINDGATWQEVTPPNTGNTGSYDWVVPTTPTSLGRVRISDPTGLLRPDMSHSPFMIRGATVWYVDADAPGPARDGRSWATAFPDLVNGILAVQSGDELRVAQGTYTPDPSGAGNRGVSFRPRRHTAVFGGYAGFGEPDPDVRDVDLYETILSGDLNGDDDSGGDTSDNSYHVVQGSGAVADETTLLDGFTISGGDAAKAGGQGGGGLLASVNMTIAHCTFVDNNVSITGEHGGAIYCDRVNPTIVHCRFMNNTDLGAMNAGGGAIYCLNASPTIRDCTFTGNTAYRGGAIFCLSGSVPEISRCTFVRNAATGSMTEGGGAICCDGGSSPEIRECDFSGNEASACGGAVSCSNQSIPTIVQCSFKHNHSDANGGAFSCYGSSPLIRGCVFKGNTAAIGAGAMNLYIGDPSVLSCTFSGNRAVRVGGAVLFNRSNSTITNCSFSSNVAGEYGGAIYFGRSDGAHIQNCILWTDSAGLAGAEMALSSLAPASLSIVTVSHSDIEGGEESVDVAIGNTLIWDAGNLNENPRFLRLPDDGGDGWGDDPETEGVDEGADDDFGDLHLRDGSPCVNQGDPELDYSDLTDIDGEPRVMGCGADIGSDELTRDDLDCNNNGIIDECEILDGSAQDCNGNTIPDACDLAAGFSRDCNGNGVPDECDIAGGFSEDCNGNGVPDECDTGPDRDSDCDGINDPDDNCPHTANPDQRDVDFDGRGDVCDVCVDDATNTCTPDRSKAGMIGPDGGILSTGDGSVTVIVPAGALSGEIYLSITGTGTLFELWTDLGDGIALFGASIQPDGQVFDIPVTIILSWRDDDNDGTVDGTAIQESGLIVTKDHIQVEGTHRCDQDPGCRRAENSFTFQVSSLSDFAVVSLHNMALFFRGDANADGNVNIADAVYILSYLFAGAPAPPCPDAADANDDGTLDIADAVAVLNHLFSGSGELPEPFGTCGGDPTADQLGCTSFPPCE